MTELDKERRSWRTSYDATRTGSAGVCAATQVASKARATMPKRIILDLLVAIRSSALLVVHLHRKNLAAVSGQQHAPLRNPASPRQARMKTSCVKSSASA